MFLHAARKSKSRAPSAGDSVTVTTSLRKKLLKIWPLLKLFEYVASVCYRLHSSHFELFNCRTEEQLDQLAFRIFFPLKSPKPF